MKISRDQWLILLVVLLIGSLVWNAIQATSSDDGEKERIEQLERDIARHQAERDSLVNVANSYNDEIASKKATIDSIMTVHDSTKIVIDRIKRYRRESSRIIDSFDDDQLDEFFAGFGAEEEDPDR